MASETGWIFGSYDPGVEYRSKPDDPDVVQRRKKFVFTRYKLSQDQLPTVAYEGDIVPASTLGADNGEIGGERPLSSNAQKFICTEVRLDNEGGQGSGMYRATEVWEAYSDWYDWTTIEADLGTANPFT